jgi:hypothetical protein
VNRTTVYLEGALEPLILDEPTNATALNMSAAVNNNIMFFQGKCEDGKVAMISIPKILYMKDDSDDD